MHAVSNVGVWLDEIYMGEEGRGRGRKRVMISLKHSGGSQTGMGSIVSYGGRVARLFCV